MKLGKIEKTALKWGGITFLGLGLYFQVMKILGLIHVLELRVLNAAIMFAGCYFAIREIRSSLEEFDYFKGMGTGLLTALTASSLFTLFGIIYLEVIDPAFMTELIEKEPLGHLLNPYLASFQIFIEGSASGFTISYAIMQFMKKPALDKVK